jgi:MFS family permease
VWVKELTGSDELAALCVLALCVLALWAPTPAGPALGTLADRVRRKPLLTAGMLLLAGLLLTLFVVDSRDTVWLLFAVLFVYGAVGVVHDAAESALVAAAVAPRLLGDFNGLRTTAVEGMKLVAPLAGAGVYAAYGGASVALLDAATFVLATRMYAALPVREAPPQPTAVNWRRRTAEGARYLCVLRGGRRWDAGGADRRPDRRPARDAGAAAGPGHRDGQLPGPRTGRARADRGSDAGRTGRPPAAAARPGGRAVGDGGTARPAAGVRRRHHLPSPSAPA